MEKIATHLVLPNGGATTPRRCVEAHQFAVRRLIEVIDRQQSVAVVQGRIDFTDLDAEAHQRNERLGQDLA